MEEIEGIDVLTCYPGDHLRLDIDVSISSQITIDLQEFKRVLEEYARDLIVDYEDSSN